MRWVGLASWDNTGPTSPLHGFGLFIPFWYFFLFYRPRHPDMRTAWHACAALSVIAMGVRLHTAHRDSSTFHPDEIYQSIEMAHVWVHGSGVRPCEFAHDPDPEFTQDTEYQQMRSPLYPGTGIPVGTLTRTRQAHAVARSQRVPALLCSW